MSTHTASHDSLAIGARIAAVLVLVLGIAEVGLGVYGWIDSARTTGDAAEFAGIGYLLSLVVGVPGALAVVLGGVSLCLGRHAAAAFVTAAAGAVVALVPVVLFVGFGN